MKGNLSKYFVNQKNIKRQTEVIMFSSLFPVIFKYYTLKCLPFWFFFFKITINVRLQIQPQRIQGLEYIIQTKLLNINET
uniref:Transmembrane protein n=1 Tax=Rhizophora mucronata TaxID=61149 RepID=A0A2P2P217_RHIMU